MGYRLINPAANELAQATETYENASVGLGQDFLDEFDAALEYICMMPDAWHMIDNDFRRYHMHRFPYSIIYRKDGDDIIVTSIFHQHRKPNSWGSIQ